MKVLQVQKTVAEWQQALGSQIRQVRFDRQLTQEEVAIMAGVSKLALRRLELGEGATVHTMVSIVRALERQDWLQALRPATTVSPMQLIKGPKFQQRVRKVYRKAPLDGGADVMGTQ